MLAFITSLRHPQNSADYSRVEQLLKETLGSVTNQSNEDYVVIVVGNQPLSFEPPERVHFVQVDFPPPAPPSGPRTEREPFIWDKGTKVGAGLLAARRFSPDYIMIFDADDFVHRDIVDFVSRNPGQSGWFIDEGWVYSRTRNGYRAQHRFNEKCGTSYILDVDAYGLPQDIDETATQSEIAEGFGDRLRTIMGAHRHAIAWHSEHGRRLSPLPFRGAIYHVDTGENHSLQVARGVLRPLDKRLADAYGIRSTRGRASTLLHCLGPVAIAESVLVPARRTAISLRDKVRGVLNARPSASADD